MDQNSKTAVADRPSAEKTHWSEQPWNRVRTAIVQRWPHLDQRDIETLPCDVYEIENFLGEFTKSPKDEIQSVVREHAPPPSVLKRASHIGGQVSDQVIPPVAIGDRASALRSRRTSWCRDGTDLCHRHCSGCPRDRRLLPNSSASVAVARVSAFAVASLSRLKQNHHQSHRSYINVDSIINSLVRRQRVAIVVRCSQTITASVKPLGVAAVRQPNTWSLRPRKTFSGSCKSMLARNPMSRCAGASPSASSSGGNCDHEPGVAAAWPLGRCVRVQTI